MNFAEKVNILARAFTFSITSWHRSRKRNKAVGGAPNSMHLLGLAVDVVLDSRRDAKEFITMAKRLKLWTLDEGDHIHIQDVIL